MKSILETNKDYYITLYEQAENTTKYENAITFETCQKTKLNLPSL